MQRIAIVGSGGAGKTTLANALARQLGLPVIHLDEHHWQPGWVATEPQLWRERQETLMAGDRWVADGNYSSTLDVRLTRADTVVVLALSRWRCLLRITRRWMSHRGQSIQAAGCPERLSLEFLRWVWTYPQAGRARLNAALDRYGSDAELVELTSPSEVKQFLAAASVRQASQRPTR